MTMATTRVAMVRDRASIRVNRIIGRIEFGWTGTGGRDHSWERDPSEEKNDQTASNIRFRDVGLADLEGRI